MIVRKRLTQYFQECLNGPPIDLAPTDVDDMFVDSLKEQASNLAIPGFIQEDNGRLGYGFIQPSTKAIAGPVNPKKIRQLQEQPQQEDTPRKKLATDQEKKREVIRLKKELTEKENLAKRVSELEEESRKKE